MTKQNEKASLWIELKRRNVYRVFIAYVIATWLILQIMDILVPLIGAPDWVPRFVFVILAIGFPIALLFTWAFELTPDGIKRERDVDRSESITAKTGGRLDAIIIGIFIVSVGWIVIDRVLPADDSAAVAVSAPPDDSGRPSVAVLPFVNMSANEDSAYFSDGLADTLLHMLAQSSELHVAARTSSFQFRDYDGDIGSIARQLHVATILEGSVQWSGDQIRITAQLIDASSGYHLWSGNFDREFVDVFAIQDEIAGEVVTALKVSLLGEEQIRSQVRPTNNIEAYREYLQGVDQIQQFSFESLQRALRHFEAAVALDPDYATAWVGIGKANISMQETGVIDKLAMHKQARLAVDKALALDPELPGALSISAYLAYAEGDKENVETLLKQAIELGPNDVHALTFYANYLNYEGRDEQALEVLKEALALDPLSVELLQYSIFAVSGLGRNDEWLRLAARIRELSPQSPFGYYQAAFAERAQGNWAQAILWMVESCGVDTEDPELPVTVGDYYMDLDLLDEADRWFQRAAEISPDHPFAMSALLAGHVFRRDHEAALKLAREQLIVEIGERHGSRLFALTVVARTGDLTGDYSEFLSWTRRFYPGLFQDPPVDIENAHYLAARVGRARMMAGDVNEGRQLLEQALEIQGNLDAVHGANRQSISISALADNLDEASQMLAVLSETPLQHNAWLYRMEHPPWLARIYDTPVYGSMRAEFDEHAAEQREILKELSGGVYP